MHEVYVQRTKEGVRLVCQVCGGQGFFQSYEFERFNDFIDAHRGCPDKAAGPIPEAPAEPAPKVPLGQVPEARAPPAPTPRRAR